MNRGVGYLYPHDYEHAMVTQQYLPDSIKDHRYLKLSGKSKYEQAFHDAQQNIKSRTKKK